MKILLVEDEYEKVGFIHSLVGSLAEQADRVTIKTVRSANDAKFEIQSTQYEIMIIDLHIPDIEGGIYHSLVAKTYFLSWKRMYHAKYHLSYWD